MKWKAENEKPSRSGRGDGLRELKERLLREWLDQNDGARLFGSARLPSLAAGEAEAIAWQTGVPLLVFPVLLEEKLEGVRRYAAGRGLGMASQDIS